MEDSMHIALLEDEQTLAADVQTLLSNAGHSVMHFPDGHQIMRALLKDTFDLLVLDWNVPGPDGLEVLKHVRNNMKLDTPVIFLTSNNSEQQIVIALNTGADDYCTKPIRPFEFMARVSALQRRFLPKQTLEFDGELTEGYVFERSQRTVSIYGKCINLTEKEYELARLMFQNIDRPISRHRIMQEVWGREEDTLSRTLDVHISWVRRKLGIGAGAQYLRLVVVHGFGYRLMKITPQESEQQ
jgi:two-component system response regulator RegX3